MATTISLATTQMDLYNVAYGNGKYIGTGTGSDAFYTSTNGSTWTTITLPYEGTHYSGTKPIIYANNKFIIADNVNAFMFSSTDGVTWVKTPFPEYSSFKAITYGNGIFYAAGTSNYPSFISTDGISWSSTPNPFASQGGVENVTFGNGIFMATNVSSIKKSTNGTSWSSVDMPFPDLDLGGFRPIEFFKGKFYFGAYFGIICSTTDGITWDNLQLEFDGLPIEGLAVVGASSNYLIFASWEETIPFFYTQDGITWDSIMGICPSSDGYGTWKDIAVSPSNAVIGTRDSQTNVITFTPAVVIDPVTFTTIPGDKTVTIPDPLVLTWEWDGGVGPYTIQVLKDGIPLGDPEETNDKTKTVIIDPTEGEDAGIYVLKVISEDDIVISDPTEVIISESLFFKFRCLQHDWTGSAEWNTSVNETYFNSNYFVNRVSDTYTFTGEYILKNKDVKDLYNFWQVQRGNEFTFTDGSFGVTSMFGPQVTDSSHTAVINSITYDIMSAGYKRVTINLIKVG